MFTGLIESIGIIKSAGRRGNYVELVIAPQPMFTGMQRGESVAVSGPCLTVTTFNDRSFAVEVSQETLDFTTVKNLKAGSRVNLERALRADGRLGGHLVTGHIDRAARILRVTDVGRSRRMEIELPSGYERLVVEKGSIAVDGVSLTVIDVGRDRFAVNLIPETLERTTLGWLRRGEEVNLEFDLLGKYILRFMEASAGSKRLTLEALRQMGYGS